MYDLERINIITRDMDKYFLKLKEIGLDEKNIYIPEKFYSSSMLLFSILNRMIDLATEILIKNDFGMPSAYEQYFDVLANNGIVDRKNLEELRQLVKDRNLFAHNYFDMDEKEVLKVSKRIYAARDFADRIKKIVEKQMKNEKNKMGEKQ